MKERRLSGSTATPGDTRWVLIGEAGEDAMDLLDGFARSHHLTAAQFTGVGAFASATVGWFDPEAKEYRRNVVDQQCELLSLIGDVALSDDGPQIHAHAVLGLSDGSTRGGHLLGGKIYPTLEVILHESPAELRKVSHPEFGLALIDPQAT